MNRFDSAAFAAPECDSPSDETEEPPGSPRRHAKWQDVTDTDWGWKIQQPHRTTSQLREFFDYPDHHGSALASQEEQYKLAIPPYYFSLIDLTNPSDPIGLQSLPSWREQASTTGIELDDPLEE